MKVVLFCKKPYAFGIMMPLYKELIKQKHDTIWYIPDNIKDKIPDFLKTCSQCNSMRELLLFNAEANFAPGNDFPHYLPGVKIQIFHGMAGEKSGHFRIRHYFDLYLTQGPYFTDRFLKLKRKFKNFEVKETGWCKIDTLFTPLEQSKELLKNEYKAVILYAPTFSPGLTSASKYKDAIYNLAKNNNYFIYIKFHDKMDQDVVKMYQDFAHKKENVAVSTDSDIIPLLQTCHLMISDTSSVVYEFLLLNKPVITFNSASENIRWDNISDSEDLSSVVENNLENDPYADQRQWFIENYHPFTDGNSSARMIKAAEEYITTHGIPKERKIPLLRRRKMYKTFGKKPNILMG
ncbi:CDP-glycerol glycerophosphotransferase family protein [Plebeiibacterium marinum]|uniref:CDP-glycerol glycerophosphotransferase family protein n=1 Tax=Plebeiibacterium marinum TaxID=2992111 RepID=A0AAE3SLB6_9BACT|nr:CDP-glycerol glycerophosphotransferase family protein [Plebeiobacterium marinum]MCW3806395.1 CDP-glycerol glycerophosphotransferase family protein [Plebeiobacterium marinum]